MYSYPVRSEGWVLVCIPFSATGSTGSNPSLLCTPPSVCCWLPLLLESIFGNLRKPKTYKDLCHLCQDSAAARSPPRPVPPFNLTPDPVPSRPRKAHVLRLTYHVSCPTSFLVWPSGIVPATWTCATPGERLGCHWGRSPPLRCSFGGGCRQPLPRQVRCFSAPR